MATECTWDVLRLLEAAERAGASDLHLSAGEVPRLRVDGLLRPVEGVGAMDADAVAARLAALMAPTAAAAFAATGDIDLGWQVGDARFRINAFCHARGPAAVLRRIPGDAPTLTSIGAPPALAGMVHREEGLMLVCGATGSGKSTSLAAVVDAINRERDAYIVTVEDPIEFVHTSRRSLVSQRQVGRDTADFATTLRAVLREDPDVLLVGELRDLQTIRLALTAAETGHLVLATLRERGAAAAIDRIVGSFPQGERDLVRGSLAASLALVVCQRLLPRAGVGRVAAHEVLVATPAVVNLIRESRVAQLESAMQTAQASGMQTMAQAIERLTMARSLVPTVAR
jgi:twitching motility protein PilT